MSSYCAGNAMCGCTSCPACLHHLVRVADPTSGSDPIEEALDELAPKGRMGSLPESARKVFKVQWRPILQRLYDAGKKARMEDRTQRFPFYLEKRANVWILQWKDDMGCRPATEPEIVMWEERTRG